MSQKYKVFLEEKVIYFTDIEMEDVHKITNSISKDYSSLHQSIENENQIISANPLKTMTNFFVGYKFIEAAGGIVKSENSFLFIKRNGLWDIPKGKIEKKETPEIAAIREIQEECGITGELIIRKKIIDTYHTYKFKNKSVLKKTHWYYLDYFGDKSTKPQLEEGITEIQWLPLNRFSIIESTTYPSIRDVLTEFGNS
ncbi:MAG: NUDIX hydrolase [Crocinitomicaceae bacterium]|jgi:8-oxo-dGTP pyrophosphatase MutT (NUDIX family)